MFSAWFDGVDGINHCCDQQKAEWFLLQERQFDLMTDLHWRLQEMPMLTMWLDAVLMESIVADSAIQATAVKVMQPMQMTRCYWTLLSTWLFLAPGCCLERPKSMQSNLSFPIDSQWLMALRAGTTAVSKTMKP